VVIWLFRGVLKSSGDVSVVQVRVVFVYLVAGGSGREQIEDVSDPNPKSAQTRAATPLFGVDGDPMQLAHTVFGPCRRLSCLPDYRARGH